MTATKACCDESDALCTAGRSVAQSGSAPGLGPGGRRFESYRSDHHSTFLVDPRSIRVESIFCRFSEGGNPERLISKIVSAAT